MVFRTVNFPLLKTGSKWCGVAWNGVARVVCPLCIQQEASQTRLIAQHPFQNYFFKYRKITNLLISHVIKRHRHTAFQGEKLTTGLYQSISTVLILQCTVICTQIIYSPPILADAYFFRYNP